MSDTLREAEQDHFLDCPNADFLTRAAALLLDVILCTLASSAIHHFCTTLATSLSLAPALSHFDPSPFWAVRVQRAGQYVSWVLKFTVFYLYLIWSVQQFGGTPAKLLLGMRVVDEENGERLSHSTVLVREAVLKPVGLLLGVGCTWALIRKDRRALHDLVCGSVVKKVRGAP